MNKRHTHVFRPLSMAILLGILGFLVACQSPALYGEYAPDTTRLALLQPAQRFCCLGPPHPLMHGFVYIHILDLGDFGQQATQSHRFA